MYCGLWQSHSGQRQHYWGRGRGRTSAAGGGGVRPWPCGCGVPNFLPVGCVGLFRRWIGKGCLTHPWLSLVSRPLPLPSTGAGAGAGRVCLLVISAPSLSLHLAQPYPCRPSISESTSAAPGRRRPRRARWNAGPKGKALADSHSPPAPRAAASDAARRRRPRASPRHPPRAFRSP
jgi:hypothetical protein